MRKVTYAESKRDAADPRWTLACRSAAPRNGSISDRPFPMTGEGWLLPKMGNGSLETVARGLTTNLGHRRRHGHATGREPDKQILPLSDDHTGYEGLGLRESSAVSTRLAVRARRMVRNSRWAVISSASQAAPSNHPNITSVNQ
jgi:hypothetical protein